MNIRAEAAKALAPVLKRERSLQSEFEGIISRVPEREKGFFHELVFGCLRHFEHLDALASKLISKKLKAKDADIQALVLLGLYQLKFMRTPDHAAISETVNAAAKLKKIWAKKLLNGVLRTYLRENEALNASLADNTVAQYNCPKWLLPNIQNDWPDDWQSILEATAQQAPLTARINLKRLPRDEAKAILESEGLTVELCEFSRFGLTISGPANIASLRGFKEGWLSVQDEAAQLAADLLLLQPAMRVLDACAAPGGKTCHILESEPELTDVHAIELDPDRGQRIRENFQRLNVSATLHFADASDLDAWWNGVQFDRILLDAPCSATGVIRRHPDIKLMRRAEDLTQLAEIQESLLHALWQTLKPGGILLYATCSILKQENEHVVARFIQQTDSAQCDTLDANWGQARDFGRQLFPHTSGHDGFYYARLKKQIDD